MATWNTGHVSYSATFTINWMSNITTLRPLCLEEPSKSHLGVALTFATLAPNVGAASNRLGHGEGCPGTHWQPIAVTDSHPPSPALNLNPSSPVQPCSLHVGRHLRRARQQPWPPVPRTEGEVRVVCQPGRCGDTGVQVFFLF